jgi:hypothetical protein
VLGSLDRQPVPGVVVYHLRDGEEPSLEVAQLEVSSGNVATYTHVHVTAGTPESETKTFKLFLFLHCSVN